MASYQNSQQSYPLTPFNVMPKSDDHDQESTANSYSKELKKKKRIKCLLNVSCFALFLTLILLVSSLTVLRTRSPKVRLENIKVTNSGEGSISFSAQVAVRNINFGRYSFDGSLATVSTSGGASVGQFVIPEGSVRARSTEKLYIIADINYPSRERNTSSGILGLTSQATLPGQLEVMKLFKRKKFAVMSCAMSIDLTTDAIQDLICK